MMEQESNSVLQNKKDDNTCTNMTRVSFVLTMLILATFFASYDHAPAVTSSRRLDESEADFCDTPCSCAGHVNIFDLFLKYFL